MSVKSMSARQKPRQKAKVPTPVSVDSITETPVSVDSIELIKIQLSETILLDQEVKDECSAMINSDTTLIAGIAQSWRKKTPKCRCVLMSKKCFSAAATRMDIFEAAAKGDKKTLSWYLNNYDPKEVCGVHGLPLQTRVT